MLTELHIENLAVVEDVTLTFGEGLNVLTGATGAGKSLILSAVNLLLGRRAPAGTIRAGADRAVVEGTFVLGRPVDSVLLPGLVDKTLRVRREIHENGRTYAFVDGKPCTLKQLQELSEQLIEPHGQNEQLQLRNSESHITYLDKRAAHGELRERYDEALESFTGAAKALSDFDQRVEMLREKQELLEHRLDELERLSIEPGEKSELQGAVRVMESAQQIAEVLGSTIDSIYDDEESAYARVSHGRGQVSRLERIGEDFRIFAEQLHGAEIGLKEVAQSMRSYLDTLEFDSERLAHVQARLATIIGLERRYQLTIDELLEAATTWKSELESIAFEDEERSALQKAHEGAAAMLRSCAMKLHSSRVRAAGEMDREMTAELEALMMPGARFRTDVTYEPDPSSELKLDGQSVRVRADGIDVVTFRVRTNPGESEGQVAEIASGGELARIALALKKVTSIGREGSVLVLDEIDSGVGGDLGEMIAAKLLAISERYQIICITHMPHIAAAARSHLVVSKRTDGGRTFADIAPVEKDERLSEVARMLGGSTGSDKRLELAREMLHNKGTKLSPGTRP
ncbi:MAG: DNA repair protein RecN [bacterium]|nr:DNA repair protein RecN [bacterium]